MTRYLIALLVAFIACQTTEVRADDGSANGVPELAALSNYVGTWDVAITSKDSPFAKGHSAARWILDDIHFISTTAAEG